MTGKIIEVDGLHEIDGVNFEVADFLPHTNSEENSLRYRRDSKLLAVLGSLDEDEFRAGAYYYIIDHERLVLVHATKVHKKCD